MTNEMKNLMFDLADNKEIFDAEADRVISKAEANETLAKFAREGLGLNENSTHRQIKRALETEKGKEMFQVIEEVIDRTVATGWQTNEFFNEFVETKNMADGDKNEFWIPKDIILMVDKVAGDHHDLTAQRLAEGTYQSISSSVYGIKVGSAIREFITGRKNWSDFTDAVAKAYIKEIQNSICTAFMGASALIPESSQFNKTGALGSATKDTFDTLIEDVSMANENAPVVIMGTKTALKKLNALSDVNWRPDSVKEAMAHTGLIGGDYEGTALLEIPQRFAYNDLGNKLVDNTKLFIMPTVDNRFVKFVDYGETELTVDQIGDTMDDRQTYEVTRRMGVGAVITRRFGLWTLQ